MAGTDSGFGIGLNYTGLKDLIVVHTPDATPAADKRDEESVRKLIWLPPIWLTCLRQQEMELLGHYIRDGKFLREPGVSGDYQDV